MSNTDTVPPRTFPLPLGFSATMMAVNGRLGAKGDPAVPTNNRSSRHRHKLLAAYQAARAEYAQLVANTMGGAVMVVDTHDADGKDNPGVRVFRPAVQP